MTHKEQHTESRHEIRTSPNEDECILKVLEQNKMLKNSIVAQILDSMPNASFVVNSNRRIILFNQILNEVIGETRPDVILGKLPGEILQCENSDKHTCGSNDACAYCGANCALQNSFSGGKSEEECMILSNYNGTISSHTFKVTAAPIEIKGEIFSIVHLSDISDRKNKEIVEKLFLHDLLNAVTGITGAGTLIRDDTMQDSVRELASMIVDRATFMANEINGHRLFVSAENRMLELNRETVSVPQIINSIEKLFSGSSLAKSKELTINKRVESFELMTDKQLLYRILENLIKNAGEASPYGGVISLRAEIDQGQAMFTVGNEGAIPRAVAHQIFKRSFSTKGKGRGLGTYSVKLFAENYLHGKVWFDSSAEDGTNFYVKLPLTKPTEDFT